jgi:hypothetical protein
MVPGLAQQNPRECCPRTRHNGCSKAGCRRAASRIDRVLPGRSLGTSDHSVANQPGLYRVFRLEANQADIKIGEPELLELAAEQVHVQFALAAS